MYRVRIDTILENRQILADVIVDTCEEALMFLATIHDFVVEELPGCPLVLVIFRNVEESEVPDRQSDKLAAAIGSIQPWSSRN